MCTVWCNSWPYERELLCEVNLPKENGGNEESLRRSCLVIGAGLAGLSAAYKLRLKGWHVTILEARDRIGGRVFTYHFRENPDLYCELGGEWVGDDHDQVISLCNELGLELIPHRYDLSFAELGCIGQTFKAGVWPFEKSLKAKLDKAVMTILNAPDIEKQEE